MRKIHYQRMSSLLAGLPVLSLFLTSCSAPERTVDIEVTQVYAAEPVLGERAALYFTVTNGGSSDDELLSVSTPVAGVAEIHRTIKDGDLMKMMPVQRLLVPAGAQLQLLPGGNHVMLLELRRQLSPGDRFDATLHFRSAGEVTVRGLVLSYADLEEKLTATQPES
jgi:copper(I)-binding protein